MDRLRVIASPHKLGFPAGLNLGRAAARGRFEAEAVALRAESQSLRDELARSQELVESIVSGRWWRLRGRLRR